jgi:amino acid permease
LATFFFFLTGAFLTDAFLVGAFSLALAFGVGVGDLVAATVEVRESERKSAVIIAVVFILIDLAPI